MDCSYFAKNPYDNTSLNITHEIASHPFPADSPKYPAAETLHEVILAFIVRVWLYYRNPQEL